MSRTKDIPKRRYLNSCFSVLRTHTRWCILLFAPVVCSVIAASIIHRMSLFYIVIPGVWCFVMGCFLIDGVVKGAITDNHGTAVRAKAPLRFWLKIGIWSLAYIFAACFPVGYALQERHRAEAEAAVPMRQPDSQSPKAVVEKGP